MTTQANVKTMTPNTTGQEATMPDEGGWRTIDSAPKDGTWIQARIPGHGADNVIAWQSDAFMDSNDRPCGGWAFVTEQEPPECWTDGVCWELNEDGRPSAQPTEWKELPPPKDSHNERSEG